MSVTKKTWTNSMFSQLSHLENNNLSNRKKCKKGCNDSVAEFQTSIKKRIKTDIQSSNENWIDFFAPTSTEELAIHPKKLQEIQQWFNHCVAMKIKNPAQLCLLTGPPGSGKTTAVRILAQENKINIQEWINPVDEEIIYNLGDQIYGNSFLSSQMNAFKNFLFKASRYRSLLETNNSNKCLIMVEDFPNFLLKNSTIFQEILEDYVSFAKSPLIFIVTDAKTRGLNINYNLFTDEIKQKFLITHISLNAVATTIMQKSMKRFCALMRSPSHCQIYKSPPPDVIDSIIVSAQGDVRNALISLHFSSLQGAPNLLTQRVHNDEATAKKGKYENKLKSLGRDESVTMMHALGRVFNPKFTESKRFVYSPEELSEIFSTEPKKFIDLVHSNYIAHFSDIEYVSGAADGLSLCDLLLNEYREDSLALTGLNIGIRSVMQSNLYPVTGWMAIKGQKRIDLNRGKKRTHESKVLPAQHIITSNLYTLDYKTFVNVIAP